MSRMAILFIAALITGTTQADEDLEVAITPELQTVITLHEGRPFAIQRNQHRGARIHPYYSYTSRKCPPFCITPMVAAPGVETVGELEVLDVLSRIGQGDKTLMVVDTRSNRWPLRGIIPGAVNIPWTEFNDVPKDEVLEKVLVPWLGVTMNDGEPDFSEARTLVLYCNGAWCSQATTTIQDLLTLGYPAERLKWYRGGMQAWQLYGLTVVNCRGHRMTVPRCN